MTDQQPQAHRHPHLSQWKIRLVAPGIGIYTPPFPIFFSAKEYPHAIDSLTALIILINQSFLSY